MEEQDKISIRYRALNVLELNMSDYTSEHISKIPHLRDWIINAMIEFSDSEKQNSEGEY